MSKRRPKHRSCTSPDPVDPSADPLLNTEQAAQWLGLKAGTLQRWRTRGKGPPFEKTSRRVGYRLSALVRFAVDRTYTSTSEYGRTKALAKAARSISGLSDGRTANRT